MSLFDKITGKKSAESNKETNLNPFAKKVYNNETSEEKAARLTAEDNGKPDAKPDASAKPDFKMSDFFKSSGLYDGIDTKALTTAIRDGDEDAAAIIIAKIMENSVSVALTNANKLADQKVAAIQEKVITETKSSAETDMAIKAMNTELPFTAHEAVAPIAKTILEGFLNQGLSTEDAIANTSSYYKEVAKESGQHFGMDMRDINDTEGFNRSRMNSNDNDNSNNKINKDSEDWINVLTSGNETQETFDTAQEAAVAAAVAADASN